MAKDKQLRPVGSPESLSGIEAGKIILREAYLRTLGKGKLNDQEMQAIRERVKGAEELNTFNRLMEVGTLIEIFLHKNQINCLEAISNLQAGYFAILAILYPAEKPTAKSPEYQERLELYQLSEGLKQSPERLNNIFNTSKVYLSFFKASEVMVKDVARVLEIPEYFEETEKLKKRILMEVNNFNIMARVLRKLITTIITPDSDFIGYIPLPEQINYDRLKPDNRIIKAWRGKLSVGKGFGGLGRHWWKQETSGND